MFCNESEDINGFGSILEPAGFTKHMKEYRFKDFRRFFTAAMADKILELEVDPWWQFADYVRRFNQNRKENVLASLFQTTDETMSAFRPRKTKRGGLPNISFILRKSEPLGKEFKDLACIVTNVVTYLEIQRGVKLMRNAKYSKKYGSTAGCTLRMMEGREQPVKGGKKELVIGDLWFGSVQTAAQLGA